MYRSEDDEIPSKNQWIPNYLLRQPIEVRPPFEEPRHVGEREAKSAELVRRHLKEEVGPMDELYEMHRASLRCFVVSQVSDPELVDSACRMAWTRVIKFPKAVNVGKVV